MLVTDPKEPASNWDFAPVFDLLRSPTFGDRHDYSVAAPSDSEGHEQFDDNQKRQRDSTSLSRPNNDTHGLGDFGSLWDLINRDADSFRALEPEDTPTPISTNRQSHVRPHPRITILKRQSQDLTSGNAFSNASSTPTTPIPVPTSSKNKFASSADIGSSSHPSSDDSICKDSKRSSGKTTKHNTAIHSAPVLLSKSNRHKQDASMAKSSSIPENVKLKEKSEAFSSEGSAEIDSDTIPTVFDRPFSQRPEHLTFIPGQVGTVDSRPGQYETPPSSFDDIESTLHSESVKNIITTSVGIRVLPVDYKSATERRIGLMTKLLKDFPEYAQLVSRVGQSLIAPQKGVQSRPIHVFVDMSNVSLNFQFPVSHRIG